ncbi:hypothetical protein, partial [Mesorhizobium sp.]
AEEEVVGEDSVEWRLQESQATNSEHSAAKLNPLGVAGMRLNQTEPDAQFSLNVSRSRIRATV